jgi:hypothetical protein
MKCKFIINIQFRLGVCGGVGVSESPVEGMKWQVYYHQFRREGIQNHQYKEWNEMTNLRSIQLFGGVGGYLKDECQFCSNQKGSSGLP